MYIYAMTGNGNVVEYFEVTESPYSSEVFPNAHLVDAVHEDWIQRKRWDEAAQAFVDVLPSEANTRNSLEFTHIDADGVKHWLDDYVNDLAAGGSVDTATISEVETYLGI